MTLPSLKLASESNFFGFGHQLAEPEGLRCLLHQMFILIGCCGRVETGNNEKVCNRRRLRSQNLTGKITPSRTLQASFFVISLISLPFSVRQLEIYFEMFEHYIYIYVKKTNSWF